MIHRRKLITGLIGLVAAPAIVRASSLMSCKVIPPVSSADLWDATLDAWLKPEDAVVTHQYMWVADADVGRRRLGGWVEVGQGEQQYAVDDLGQVRKLKFSLDDRVVFLMERRA